MKLFLAVLVTTLGVSCAQQFMCECALFLEDQIILGQNALPLEYIGMQVEAGCEGEERCQNFCNTRSNEVIGELNLCSQDKVQNRCFGSTYCEVLNNQGWGNVANGVIRSYARIRGCPESEWTDSGYAVEDNICCSNAIYGPCDDDADDCDDKEDNELSCVPTTYCECGLFANDQIEGGYLPEGATAIPLVNLARTWDADPDRVCMGWPDPDLNHICDRECIQEGNGWIANNTLADTYPNNPALTYGQAMCYGLWAKWQDNWPVEGVQQNLNAWGRLPTCSENAQWEVKYEGVQYPDLLCCTGRGAWDPDCS